MARKLQEGQVYRFKHLRKSSLFCGRLKAIHADYLDVLDLHTGKRYLLPLDTCAASHSGVSA